MKTLIIDDEANICEILKVRLPEHGFLAETAHTGKQGLAMARVNEYDVLIVDFNLPDMSGDELVAAIRNGPHTPPILMCTVVDDTSSKVRLLNSGADDYLVKPFAFEELLARMRALTRRPNTLLPEVLSIGNLTLNTATQTVIRGNKKIDLTRKEFGILERLLRQPDAVISKGDLINMVWDSEVDPFSASFDTHLTNLRKKLGKPELIHTVPARGYKLA